jgi:hypothetical protein
MHHKLLITVCSVALIASSANAAQGVAGKVGASAGAIVKQQQDVSVPRALPVARDGEIIDSVGGGATEAVLPVVQKSKDISYITGGIGDEEMAEIDAQAHNFNARILLIAAQGEYMSEVAIRFLDKNNAEILRVDSVGPFFYVNLPNGTYTVEAASTSGAIQKAKLVVPAKNQTAKTVIRFNE